MSEHHQHVKAQKSQHFEKLLFTPPMLVSLGLFPPSSSILLPPSLLCVIYTLSPSLALSLSDALLSKSRLLCSELFCDLFLIFVSTLPSGRWTERERGRTHSPIQSLPGVGGKSWLRTDQGCVTISAAGPHCDLDNFCSAIWEGICFGKPFELSLSF